ncbi:MAG: deoxyribose-phosphate aldolase [Phycisphaeraceae bacterium]|nr:deoxyribose-phosphate aldolase [Phycisphaeraceae bacterium]
MAMDIACRIDHTLLKPEATAEDVKRIVAEAMAHGFASVCVNPVFTGLVGRLLKGSAVKNCAVIGFPLGAHKATVKAMEAVAAVKEGAEELDIVAHLPLVLAKDLAGIRGELAEIVPLAKAANPKVVIKVIVESALLALNVEPAEAEERIAVACRAVKQAGCEYIKTSTGFHPAGGATAQAVGWMKKHADGLRVKASGGIRSYADAQAMMAAGADRLGCSAGVAIVQEALGRK